MNDAHSKRRLELARWYAREAIVSAATGDDEKAADELATACEYLHALLGRRSHVVTADDAIALICQIEDGSVAVTA